MTRNINITGKEWLELVFAEKNKSYGAYAIRSSTTRRHLTAYFVIIVFTAMILVFPTVKKLIAPASTKSGIKTTTVLSNLVMEPPPVATKDLVAPPPPEAALKKTIKFTVTKIVEDNVAEEEVQPLIDEILIDKDAGISTITQEGVPGGTEDPTDIGNPFSEETFFTGTVEQESVFPDPGGLMKWIAKELKYPAAAIDMDISGRVTVQFTIGTDGIVKDVIVLSGIDPLLDKEAVRVVSKMPKWIPGKHQGKLVAVRFVIPITFRLHK
jgi:protein TonB